MLGADLRHGLHPLLGSCHVGRNLLRRHCSDLAPHQQRTQSTAVFRWSRIHSGSLSAGVENNQEPLLQVSKIRWFLDATPRPREQRIGAERERSRLRHRSNPRDHPENENKVMKHKCTCNVNDEFCHFKSLTYASV